MKVAMSATRYELLADLGEGAQGRVVRVRDRERDAVVALKAVPASARATLVREFARLASIDHPSVPRAYDLGTLAADLGPIAAGTPYYTAEEIVGRPLAAGAPLDPIGVWAVAIDVAAALVALHGAGLVHCDVSPGNVMIVGAGAARRAIALRPLDRLYDTLAQQRDIHRHPLTAPFATSASIPA